MGWLFISFFLHSLFVLVSLSAIASGTPKLILDFSDLKLRNFRMCSNIEKLTNVNTKGLSDLKCSGSAQLSVEGFAELKKHIKSEQIADIDLRQESHGFINNKYPISWYGKHNWDNIGKSLLEINTDELIKLNALPGASPVSFVCKKSSFSTKFNVQLVHTEGNIAAKNHYIYIRLPVANYCMPDNKTVNEFVKLVAGLPKNVWYHFHCRAGMGRTTTFMSMFDMMYNAGTIPLDEILKRQYLLGGTNLTKIDARNSKKINLCKKERLIFLKEFYQYCLENKRNKFKTSWTDWEKEKNEKFFR